MSQTREIVTFGHPVGGWAMSAVIPGAEPWSVDGDRPHGALVLHGFTGNPDSMRGLAEAFAAAGFHVEMPLLPGHGTVVADMIPTRWADWLGAAESAYQRLAGRCEQVVVAGLSMGGVLTLRLGADHPDIAGLVCVNPAAAPPARELLEAVREMLAGGMELMPGIGSDIADPDATEKAYPETPLAAILSLVEDGLTPVTAEYPAMRIPLLLFTSPQDHVVEPAQSDYLAEHYGGPVERVPLMRSYHVATQDYDKQLIFDRSVAFAETVTA
jgi:carboxylesterase